jgi:hypothetical protein
MSHHHLGNPDQQLGILQFALNSLDPEVREFCFTAAILMRFDLMLLGVLSTKSGADLQRCFDGIIGLPFVEKLTQGYYRITPVNRFMLMQLLLKENPVRYRLLNQQAADYSRQQNQTELTWHIATLYHGLIAGQDGAVDHFIQQGIEWVGNNLHQQSAEELVGLVLIGVELGSITGLAAAWAYVFQSSLDITRDRYPEAIANLAESLRQSTDDQFVHSYAVKTLGQVHELLKARYKAVQEPVQPTPTTPTTPVATGAGRQVDRARVRELMTTYLDMADLQQICFDLNEDYDTIVGQNSNKREIVLDILMHFARLSRLPELIDKCALIRPQLEWWPPNP